MNIFEALRDGHNKAYVPIISGKFASRDLDGKICWYGITIDSYEVKDYDLCRNDWIPYVPTIEKTKHKKEFTGVYFYKCVSSGYIFPASSNIGFVKTLENLTHLNSQIKMTLEWEE